MAKIIPEDWGGNIICSPISALKNKGIDELLDMVLLTTESMQENIKANPLSPAVGTIIESHIDKGSGPVATILIQNGTLKFGDQLMLNGISIGKVRNLKNYLGQEIKEAGPASPVQIIGLKFMPKVGDLVQVGDGTKINYKKMKALSKRKESEAVQQNPEQDEDIKKINLIIKSDVLGSAEAIEESLEKINTEEIKVKIVRKGLGNINENDIGGKGGLVVSGKGSLIIETQKSYKQRGIVIKNGKMHGFNAIISKNENQMIDSIHRCRPLAHTRIVIVLGKMRREFGLNTNGKTMVLLKLIRVRETIFSLPLAYIGVLIAAEEMPSFSTWFYVTTALISARTLGMCLNRIFDKNIDYKKQMLNF